MVSEVGYVNGAFGLLIHWYAVNRLHDSLIKQDSSVDTLDRKLVKQN